MEMTPTPPEPLEGFAITFPYLARRERKLLFVMDSVFGRAEFSLGDLVINLYFVNLSRL
jgi:hypothetical protein